MISPKSSSTNEHSGLITYILHQLKHTKNPIFRRYLQDLHIQLQEAKLPHYTPHKLLMEVEDKIQVPNHADEWDAVENQTTPAMALTTTLSNQMTDFLTKQISAEFTKFLDHHKTKTVSDGKQKGKFQHQDWMFVPQQNPNDTKTVNNKEHKWRLKSNQGKGQWVMVHDTSTHVEGFRPQCRNNNTWPPLQGILKNASPTTTYVNMLHSDTRVSLATMDHDQSATTSQDHSVQLSLPEGLQNCFQFDVDDITNDN